MLRLQSRPVIDRDGTSSRRRLFYLTGLRHFFNMQDVSESGKDREDEGWEYGEVWKDGSPDDPVAGDTGEYVEILRGDTGMGYNDTTMLEYVLFLGEHGIKATFDSYPLEQIKIYVLRVEAGKEEEALALFRKKRKGTE
jgi:hypothetical protein